VHKFEQFVYYSLEKLPVRFKKSWVLADDIHDARRDDGLVVLATLNLDQAQQAFDDGD
jgi:hypothetical protein